VNEEYGVIFTEDRFNPEGVLELLDRRTNAVKDINCWSVQVMKWRKEFEEISRKLNEAEMREREAWDSLQWLTKRINEYPDPV
jgi:hypothetical protein